MNLHELVQAQIDGQQIRMSFLMRIATEPRVRIWGGAGDLEIPADFVETEGGIYSGFGTLVSVPAVSTLMNGTAQRLEFALSGVDDQIVALADLDAEEVRSKDVNLGMQFFTEDWQPAGPVMWIWDGEADVLKTSSVGAPGTPDRARSIRLSVGSIMTGRRRPRLNFFTRAQQRRRSPLDAFCDRTGLYSQGTEIKWPP